MTLSYHHTPYHHMSSSHYQSFLIVAKKDESDNEDGRTCTYSTGKCIPFQFILDTVDDDHVHDHVPSAAHYSYYFYNFFTSSLPFLLVLLILVLIQFVSFLPLKLIHPPNEYPFYVMHLPHHHHLVD